MTIRYTQEQDQAFVMSIDKHVSDALYQTRVIAKAGYVMWEQDARVGLMSYVLLWDNIPFLNFIYVLDSYRNRGYASAAMREWEADMKRQGFKMTLISTQVDETAQHFYRKLGYVDCGGLLLDHTPFEQPMELFMRRVL